LLLVLLAGVLYIYLLKSYRVRVKRWRFVALMVTVVLSVGFLAFTSNPIQNRYSEVMRDNLNGVSLRLFIWRCAGEILNEQHAWVFGVSAGDSRDLLNAKYMAAGMSHGYIGYNCHNQYVEVLLRSGITGLCVFLATIGLMIGFAWRKATLEWWIAILSILLLSFTESMLEMQQPAFLCCFFPLLFWLVPDRRPSSLARGRRSASPA
jgi:O-antigen ligase